MRLGYRVGWATVIVVLGVVAVVGWRFVPTFHPPVTTALVAADAPRPSVRRETRPTLDPSQFVGKAAATHRIAREIPDVLDAVDCYCGCDHMGHASLLSCYTDRHAVT